MSTSEVNKPCYTGLFVAVETKTNGEEKRKTEKNVRKIRNRVGKVGKDG